MDTKLTERVVDVTSKLVSIPTHETEAEGQMFLAEILTDSGFACELQEIEPNRPNLIARRGEGGPFLCSHMDIHPPHDHRGPFTARKEGERLVGRGVVDAKGQIGAIVAAVEAAPDAPACIAITCDEEHGGLGSEHLAVPQGPWFDEGGVVLEPTEFRICTAQMGNVDITIDASAEPTHAYEPDAAASPITALLAVIEELDTARFLKERHPLLPDPRINIGRIEGGEHAWRTPAHAMLQATMGIVPPVDVAEAGAEVRARLDDVARRWKDRGVDFTYEIYDTSAPHDIALDTVPIAKRLADAMGEPLAPAGMPSWTDAGYLLSKHGLPCVVFGAGELRTAHSNHESVAIADLGRLAEVLRTLLTSS